MLSTSRPSAIAAGPTSVVFTIALLGTTSTFTASSTITSTSAFMPGFNSPPRLSMLTMTGNIVTFCSTVACGSIFLIAPRKMRSGNASTVTFATMPGASWPMSVSSTSVRTCISCRFAIRNSVVPPDTLPDAD